MNYNPYAPPNTQAAAGFGAPVQGTPQPWEVSDVIKSAWETYKTHWAPLTFGIFVVTLIGAVPGQIAPGLVKAGVLENGSGAYWAVYAPLAILGWVVGEFFAAGFTRAALRAVRENNVGFGDFFSAGGRFLSYLGMSFLRSFAIVIGLVLFVIPGVILSLGFYNAGFYVVDQNLGPVASLKASWESADGQKGNLFVFALAEFGLMLLGLVACCLGIFVAIPVSSSSFFGSFSPVSSTAAASTAFASSSAKGFLAFASSSSSFFGGNSAFALASSSALSEAISSSFFAMASTAA